MKAVGLTVPKSMLGFGGKSFLLLAIAQPAAAQEPGLTRGTGNALAITSASVVDVANGSLRSNQTVLVEGGRITAVEGADQVQVPTGARVVDGSGRFLIPGLWDMHVHTGSDRNTRDIIYPLFVGHGVTGVRNMMGDCFDCGPTDFSIEQVNARRRSVAAGELTGPRVVASSAFAGSHESAARRSGEGSSPQAPATEADARAFALLAKERGVDFIKIYDMLPREAYLALAEEANGIGLPFAGHVPVQVRASEASGAGQRSIEHIRWVGILNECSSREDELRAGLIAELEKAEMGSRHTAAGAALLPLMLEMVDTHDPAKCAALAERFVRNETWVVPTLMTARLPNELGAGWREDPYARFLPPQERGWFEREEEAHTNDLGDAEEQAPVSRWGREVTMAMHRAGVPMLAASDAGAAGIFWGIGLHRELELLVSAGLTEAAALRAATLGPAEFLEATESLGTVDAGKVADLVLLEANPLEDISNTQKIAAVVLRGRYLDRKALDALLAGAERAAGAGERSDTIRVAAPAGQPDIDRPRVQEAFDRARPGDTVLFAAGTYVLGEGARLTVPDVTVMGHPDGTTIKGCEPHRFDLPEGSLMENLPPIVMGCTGLFVLADRQTIRGLTFEHAWHGILIGHPPWLASPPGQAAPDTSFGGHRIENNAFRNVPNGIRVIGPSSEVTLIRDNEVVNAYHAFVAEGATVRIVNNWITVPEPDSVPASYHPESGIIVNPGLAMGRCEGSHVVGNVIDGTVHGIQVLAAGGRGCTGHEIRDNFVRVRRVPLRPDYPRHLMNVYFGEDAEGTAVTGTAIRLVADTSATVTDVLIRNNRVLGGHGLGIQLERASGNRIAGNYISRIQRRSPFPGLTWGDDPERWRAANGSAIWISDGSTNNVVEGNAFRDIEGPAIHVDGDDNEIGLKDGDPAVRDEGRGNRVVVAPPGDVSGQ